MRTLVLIALSALTWFGAFSVAAAERYAVPRTEWGQPDLQGVWNFISYAPLERPEKFGEREFLTVEEMAEGRSERTSSKAAADAKEAELNTDQPLPPTGGEYTGSYNAFWDERAALGENPRTSLIIYPRNGRLPAVVKGTAEHIVHQLGFDVPGERPVLAVFGGIGKDGPEDRGTSERCLLGFNAGPPMVGRGYNANVQIVQNRNHVVLLTEMIHDARIVALENRPSLDDRIRLWTGNSIGYWDGDTLVVTTANFTDLAPSFDRFGDAIHKTLIERFTRTGPYTIQYEWTLNDPATFTDKIIATVPMYAVAGQLFEYACHEGNYGLTNMLRGARVQERLAASSDN